MKRFSTAFIICSTLFLFNNYCSAQLTARSDKKSMELILEVPKADAIKSFKSLKEKLSTLPQVYVEGFCDSKKLLMLKLNPKEYFNVLVAVDEAGFSYYIKKDICIAEVIGACQAGELYKKEGASLD